MKKFDVEITETLQRTVSVEAVSQEEAEKIVTEAWNNEDYVLDSTDFVGVDFKTVGEQELSENRKMEILLVQPGMYPQKVTIGTELKDFQDAVGGTIAASYPFDDPVAIVYNDEGKLTGLPLNRALRDEHEKGEISPEENKKIEEETNEILNDDSTYPFISYLSDLLAKSKPSDDAVKKLHDCIDKVAAALGQDSTDVFRALLAKLIEQPEEKQTFDHLLEMAEKFAAKYE